MKLTLAEPKYLKDSISIISELVNEAKFKITKQSLELVAMDPANVAMVIFKLLASTFTDFQVDQDEEIAINLSNLKQVLRRAKSNDAVTLETAEGKLKIQFKSDTVRTFSIPLIELEEKEQRVPELKFPVMVTTPSSVLGEAISDVDVVAESVTFLSDPAKLIISAEGDLSKAKIEINASEETKIKSTDKTKAKYSIEYLKKMIDGAKLADKVNIQFSSDYPLRLDYIAVDKVMLSFILAPRVEND
ncbi:proliferating cell nuclear antigen (pcna) [Candidatus Woesearchaeota archaeon]|nr:proliferating cell nuclear antigen (pcna) [Candidatus Woesearchaeota archaeon]